MSLNKIYITSLSKKNLSHLRKFFRDVKEYEKHPLYNDFKEFRKSYEKYLYDYVEFYWEGFNNNKVPGLNDNDKNSREFKASFFERNYTVSQFIVNILLTLFKERYDNGSILEKKKMRKQFKQVNQGFALAQFIVPMQLESHIDLLKFFSKNITNFISALSELRIRKEKSSNKNRLRDSDKNMIDYKGVACLMRVKNYYLMKAVKEYAKLNKIEDWYLLYQRIYRWKAKNKLAFEKMINEEENPLLKSII